MRKKRRRKSHQRRLNVLKVALVILSLLVVFMVGYVAINEISYESGNEEYVYIYLHEKMNLNTAATAGILGNIYYESKFEPNLHGDSETSYGICQWHKSRKDRLKAYCKENYLDYKTLDGQLQFMEHELNNHYKKTFKKIKAVDNTEKGCLEAAKYWCYEYERPAGRVEANKRRSAKAKKYFKKYSRRTE